MIGEFPDGLSVVSSSVAAAAFASGSSPTNAISVTDDINGNPEVEIEDVDLDKMLEVNSAIAVEKEIAADTIGTLFAATRNHFFPYVEPCALELVSLLDHYYEGIRKAATESLLEIVRTFYELSGAPDFTPGTPVSFSYHVRAMVLTQCLGRASPAEREGTHRPQLEALA